MMEFMEDRNLTENNFSICYQNLVTGESYRFNDLKMMTAGSTYKLPLNLYYYEMALKGEIDPDSYIDGISLASLQRESLVNSNNDYSMILMYNLGNFTQYKDCMRTYFSITDEELDTKYYINNYYCTEMMMDTLVYLYDHEDDFAQMIDYMKLAQPNEYFARTKGDYEIAHKYGYFEGAINDVGIIYTPQPFALAVYTQSASYGEQILGDVCQMLTEYTVAKEAVLVAEAEAEAEAQAAVEAQAAAEALAEAQAAAEAQALAEAEAQAAALAEAEALEEAAMEAEVVPVVVEEEVSTDVTMTTADYLLIAAVALVIFGLGGGVAVIVSSRAKDRYLEEEEEDLEVRR